VTTRAILLTAVLIGSTRALLTAGVAPPANPVLAAADAAWARRAEDRSGARASARRISEAVARYEEAAKDPDAVEPRWKLARALFFEAKFTGLDRDAQRALLEKARRAGEEAIAILGRRSAAVPANADAAPAYFWTAVAWGEWGQIVSRARAAKAGTASKIRDYSTKVIALDPEFEEGGGYRVLGRLHDRAPRIPLVTGWVSRKEALRNLRSAVRVAPRNFVNRHFLAEALARGTPAEKAEAIRIERELVAETPTPERLVEDLAIQEDAKRDLTAWTGRPS
jgi:hypothetical protein